MDARSMPNLRGLVYGIMSHGADSIPAALAKVVPIATVVASLVILAIAATLLLKIRTSSSATTDLVFASALTVALAVSFHLQIHDLTLLAVAFALVINFMLEQAKLTHDRSYLRAQILLMIPFFVMPLALLLTRYRLLFLFGIGVLGISIISLLELAKLIRATPFPD